MGIGELKVLDADGIYRTVQFEGSQEEFRAQQTAQDSQNELIAKGLLEAISRDTFGTWVRCRRESWASEDDYALYLDSIYEALIMAINTMVGFCNPHWESQVELLNILYGVVTGKFIIINTIANRKDNLLELIKLKEPDPQ